MSASKTAYSDPTENHHFRRGDVVRVRTPREILATLDDRGSLDGLPFMPEMVEICGRITRVSYHVEKTCVDGYKDTFRAFPDEDVVFLEDLRCSGETHDGCGRACRLFWKEAWLEPVEAGAVEVIVDVADREALRARLQTREEDGTYFCQSTSLLHATEALNRVDRILKIGEDVRCGNRSVGEVALQVAASTHMKIMGRLFGKWPAGTLAKTPSLSLGLIPGDEVEVLSEAEIRATLDAGGKNRGLRFTREMGAYCGNRYKVAHVLDRMILEHTGEMLDLRNTVILENVHCRCMFAFGGCHRAENSYWREIWLRKV